MSTNTCLQYNQSATCDDGCRKNKSTEENEGERGTRRGEENMIASSCVYLHSHCSLCPPSPLLASIESLSSISTIAGFTLTSSQLHDLHTHLVSALLLYSSCFAAYTVYLDELSFTPASLVGGLGTLHYSVNTYSTRLLYSCREKAQIRQWTKVVQVRRERERMKRRGVEEKRLCPSCIHYD